MKGYTVVVLNMDGEIGVAGFVRYMCRDPSIDLNGLVGGVVIRRTCGHYEEVLVCHSRCNSAFASSFIRLISSLSHL